MNTYDSNSITTASGFFTQIGYSVSKTEDEFARFDLICETPNHGTIAVEVKGRNVTLDRYPDMAVDYIKYMDAVSEIKAGTYTNVLVCSIYTDGYLALGNILEGHDVAAEGPKSTCFEDTHRYTKNYHDVPRQLVYKPTADGKWELVANYIKTTK